MTEEELQALLRGIGPPIRQAIEKATAPLLKRIDALEARESGMVWRGIWQRASSYAKGEAVTDKGSLWLALRDIAPDTRPGDGATGWVLIAKGHS